VLSPGEHVEDLVRGFEEMYRLLVRHRAVLRADDGPLSAFRDQRVRWVFRPTEQYGQILRRSVAPECLRNGCDRSIEIDHLSRSLVLAGPSAAALALLGPERRALEELDIPRFDVPADGTALEHDGGLMPPRFFDASGYDDVLDRLDSLGDADLAWQARVIRASLHAQGARLERHAGTEVRAGEAPARRLVVAAHPDWPARFLAAANRLAEEIVAGAGRNPDGSASWIGLTHLPSIGRHQVLPVDDGLYGGRAGIALFLAACDRVSRSDAHRALVHAALEPVCTTSSDRARVEEYVRTSGIGMARGIGGLVYALTAIGAWQPNSALQEHADGLALALSPELVQAGGESDVIGGAAGAVLGLMKLYRARPSPALLEVLRDCADWLCRQQIRGGEDAGGWATQAASRPLTGFAHGASGIAFALARLHSVTGEAKLLAAARAAVEFEHRAFVPDAANWVDSRRHEAGAPPRFGVAWCRGAPGIGLARLALRSALDHPVVARDLEAALAVTQAPRPDAADHACCGSFGRFDILVHAGLRLGRTDLVEAAAAQAAEILERPGSFRVTPTDAPGTRNPGLFDGLAGIGYILLRLAAPDDLPCVLAFE
jgi:type 2 lantibiotic biosynthesis protein LanM